MISITLPDGSRRQFERPLSGADLAAAIGPGLAKAALAIKIDGTLKDLVGAHRAATPGSRSSPGPIPTPSSCCATTAPMCWPRRCRSSIPARRSPSARRSRTASITTSPATRRSRRRISPRSSSACARSSTATRRSRARSGAATRIADYFREHGESFKAEWVREIPRRRGDLRLPPGQLARHVHAARICPRPASSARPSS